MFWITLETGLRTFWCWTYAEGEKWDKLCRFLGKPVPDVHFPHANEWMHLLMQATGEFREIVPPGSRFLLFDQEGFGEGFSAGRIKVPFMERDGYFNGNPKDDDEAQQELKRLLDNKPEFLVFGWPSFWYRDAYPLFFEKILQQYACILENQRIWIYKVLT